MVWSRALSRTRIALAVAGLGTAALAVVATAALAQPAEPSAAPAAPALPGANQFVSGLDLECYSTPGPALNIGLVLSHLNPVLQAMGLPPHDVVIGALAQTCVPVMKNNVAPQAAALPFIQHVDFACYKITTNPLPTPVTLNLTHLNPVLSGLPAHNVQLTQATQLCLPVAKNGVMPPANVLQLVQFLDLECYTANPIATHPTFGVSVSQLNPQLTGVIPAHQLTLVNQPRQLCVPVQKGQQVIPSNVLNIVEWTDLEQFTASPPVNITPVIVKLNHLNPMFTSQPTVGVTLQQAIGLMVPVAKNGMFPPPP
jgi:hypothetical protein